MNTTDNAFLKAYAEELAVALGRPARQVDRRAVWPSRSHAVAGQPSPRVSLSGLYASAADKSASGPRSEGQAVTTTDGLADCDTPRVATQQALRPGSSPVGSPPSESQPTAQSPFSTGATHLPRQRETLRRLDAADPMAPRHWHASFAEPVAAAGSPQRARAERAAASADPAKAAERPTGTIPPPPAECRTVRPGWEVDRFQWPAPVERLSGEFGQLLSGILDRLVAGSPQGTRVTAITGYARGEGRTTLALALARLAARRGCSVALVDGDHEHPHLAQQLGLSFDKGWDEQGGGPEEISEVAIHSLEDHLTLLPLRGGPRTGKIDRHGAAQLLKCLATTYDLLLVDVGPMFTAARYWFEGQADRAADRALVVRGVDTVSDTQLADVVERLSSRHVPIVGIVENFSVTQPIAASKLAS